MHLTEVTPSVDRDFCLVEPTCATIISEIRIQTLLHIDFSRTDPGIDRENKKQIITNLLHLVPVNHYIADPEL